MFFAYRILSYVTVSKIFTNGFIDGKKKLINILTYRQLL